MINDDAYETYFVLREVERDLAERLDEGFVVTFGRTHGELAMWLAAPKAHMRERFGFAKELLVIYSRHPTTDARVLTAIENITRSPEFRHRIDRAVVLLIHAGDPNETKALLQEKLDWIIVPISTKNLSDPKRGDLFLRAQIAQAIGGMDLFGMSSPITDDRYFFGRNDLVQQLVTRLVERGENGGLFGLRKTGKTSVLFAIQRRLADRPVLVEYVDCQNPGIHAGRWWQVLENISQRCSEVLRREHRRTAALTGPYDETTAGTKFLSDVRSILASGELRQLVLLFDEIEYITPTIAGSLGQHWDRDFLPFWQTIRAVHHECHGKLSFIVAGVNPASVTTSHFGQAPNPIFQLAQPIFLDPLDTARVREMVRTIGRYSGLDIDESVYPYLAQTYGGHPFLVRIVCSEVWKTSQTMHPERRDQVTIESFRTRTSEIRARLEKPIRDILLSLVWWYPEEYDVLRILAEGDSAFTADYLREDPSSVLQFAHYGLLTSDGTKFAIADLREFLRNFGEEYRLQISPFLRSDMPPELLPEVPDLELLGRLFERRSEIEVKLRRALVLYLGVKFNWDDFKISQAISKHLKKRSDRLNPDHLFVGRRPQDAVNELFTLDLKEVVLGLWDTFGPLFAGKKGRFEMNMDTLNKARRLDSHTKPVPREEIEEIQNSYSWLQARLASITVPAESERQER